MSYAALSRPAHRLPAFDAGISDSSRRSVTAMRSMLGADLHLPFWSNPESLR